MEEWKDIIGYEKLYKISSAGDVWSIRKNRCLYQSNNYGYKRVALTKNKIRKFHRVHRLVARTFLGKFETNKQVNHKDSNRANNNVSNLEWCTGKENLEHAFRLGNLHKRAVLNFKKVKNIRLLLGQGKKTAEIADLFGVS